MDSIINMEHVSKRYGDKDILRDVSCGIREGEHVGILGVNGAGKSTLLGILAGYGEPDEGQVVRRNGARLSYLPQLPDFPEEETVLSYVCSGSGQPSDTAPEYEAKSMLNGLGITEHDVRLGTLSGGQKKRAALARALLGPSDILALDEPTNHLDEGMIAWLEEFLRHYRGTILFVTHDRYFLDRVAGRILEISRGALYSYEAGYTRFLELKAEREEMELAAERKRKSVLRTELSWAARGCRARSTKQKARLLRLEALKEGRAPVFERELTLDSVETRLGKKTVELKGISKSYGDRRIVEDFSYIFLKNQAVAFVGPNGCGKSTLLKLIAGQLEPDEGTVEAGETVRLGYFAQELPGFDEERRVIDYIRDIAEYVPTRTGRITASQMLERFLFTPDMQYAPIGRLSGGEKRRLYLLSVLQGAPNVLVMDEVTNELDIPTLAVLEDYLNAFVGIVILVSHDRYFLDNVADRIFAFDGAGHFRQYEGGYTDYIEALRQEEKPEHVRAAAPGREKGVRDRGPQRLRFSYKEQKEYETIEDEIAALEERLTAISAEMDENASQYGRLEELTKEREETQSRLDERMERWMYLAELHERIEAQERR